MKKETMDKVLGYIDVMAQKLGVASEHVYGVLIKQSIVNGVRDLGLGVLLLLVTYGLIKLSIWLYRRGEGEYIVGTGILLFMSSLFGIIAIYSGLGELINPEYYAIMDILDAINGDSE